ASRSGKCLCSTPLATPASAVMARVVGPDGPARASTRSVAANSCSRTSGIATPRGIGPPSACLVICNYGRLSIMVWTNVHTSGLEEPMGSGSGGQAAMTVVWVVLVVLAVGGGGGVSLAPPRAGPRALGGRGRRGWGAPPPPRGRGAGA